MPSVFKRFSTIINRDKDKDKDKDKKDKRKSLGSALGGTIRGKKEEKPAPLKSEGKRIVVVSGASVGLGVELVKRFAAEPGTFVIALDSGAPSSALKALLNDHVVAIQVPSVLEKDMSKAIGEITKVSGGRIDILVNAAVPPKHSQKTLSEILHYDIGQELSDMVATPIAITNALLPYLKKYIPPPAPPAVEPPAPVPAAATTSSEPPAAKDSATPATTTAPKETDAPVPAAAPATDSAPNSSEKPTIADTAPSSDVPAPTENGAVSHTQETTTASSSAPAADENAKSPKHEYSEGPNNAATQSVNTQPPSTGITNSDGEPVSKNELLVQKFLSDDLQDPKLAPHVEGRVFGSEAQAAEAAIAEGKEPKFESREVKPVKEGTALVTEEDVTPRKTEATTTNAASAAPKEATATNVTDSAKEPVAPSTAQANGTTTANTAAAAAPAPVEPVKPNFPANPVVAFITATRPVHSVFPPVPYATQSMAHAALHVAVSKYAHDLAARGIVVIGIEEAGWNEADALHTSDDATNHVMRQIENSTLTHNGKILRHDTSGPAVYDWASLKPNALF